MLIILHCLPVAAPSESIFAEKTKAEVASGYLVFKLAIAVEIGSAGSGFDDGFASRGVGFASSQCLCVGIVERIDVDSHTHPVFRHRLCMRYEAEVE